MNIEQTLKERAKEAETTVVSYLPEVTGYPKTVLEAMEYSVEAGGKRIRPVLCGKFIICVEVPRIR